MMMTRADFEKAVAQVTADLERELAIRMLIAYQCIKCGQIFDSPHDTILHSVHCRVSNERDDNDQIPV